MSDKKNISLLILFIVVLVSRLPFLSAGYGIEEDSWGIALEAYNSNFYGAYEPSRLPGHPVHEIPLSLLWGTGPVIFNGLSALFSAIGTLFFAKILRHLGFRFYFLASLAFAFVPVYFISSTYTIDFVWTEAFVMIALWLLLTERLIWCGVFLGLAIGCRITSGAMIIPFMILCWKRNDLSANIKNVFRIGIPMGLVAIASFIPVMIKYGPSFFMYYDQFPYPPITKVFYKMIPGVFGFIGTMTIGVAALWIIIKRKTITPGSLFEITPDKRILYACWTMLVLFTISYFRLPQKSGYMIPIIPFMIILFGYYLKERGFKLFCMAMIASSFLCSINLTDRIRGAKHSDFALKLTVSGQEIFFDPFTGPIISDYTKRLQKIAYTEEVIAKTSVLRKKTVVIAGWWYNEIKVTMLPREKNWLVIFEGYIDSQKINKYLAEGYSLVYLPEQDLYNDLMYKMDITKKVAKPFHAEL